MISPKTSAAIRIAITDMPPSANGMRTSFIRDGKVRSTKSKTYASWKETTAWEIASTRPGKIIGPYRLYIAVQRDHRSKRARDIDNTIKPVSDARGPCAVRAQRWELPTLTSLLPCRYYRMNRFSAR